MMFDPTFFDNLKVVIEGAVYDRDLNGEITVTDRSDLVDLAKMSRSFAIQFRANSESSVHAEIRLFAGISDISAELEQRSEEYGAQLQVKFNVPITSIEADIPKLKNQLLEIWQGRPFIKYVVILKPTLSEQSLRIDQFNMVAEMNLDFGRAIGEEQIEDMKLVVEYTCETLSLM